jgi:hypothetical protein
MKTAGDNTAGFHSPEQNTIILENWMYKMLTTSILTLAFIAMQ